MAGKPTPDLHDPAIAGEARHIAEEAVEEMKQGDKNDAQFVLDEARKMDREAVDEVVKERKTE